MKIILKEYNKISSKIHINFLVIIVQYIRKANKNKKIVNGIVKKNRQKFIIQYKKKKRVYLIQICAVNGPY